MTVATTTHKAPRMPGDSSTAGFIFGIERFCTDDGPGIRTTVFLKGCPLRCAWCHNPEGLSRRMEISFAEQACILCGGCVEACKHSAHGMIAGSGDTTNLHVYDRLRCTACGECTRACPTGALEVVGSEVSVQAVMREVLQDRQFYLRSGGGLTLSGGEPTAQIDFTLALLKAAKLEGLHTCLETSGFAAWKDFARLLPLVDLFLYDFKESDAKRHLDYVGQSNETILRNLNALHDAGAKIELHCPIVPSYNEREDHLQSICDLAKALPHLTGVKLIAYHPLGGEKLRRLGLPRQEKALAASKVNELSRWNKVLIEQGIPIAT